MMDHYYAVIMAGGGGTRLWPLSRVGRPKQMLSLFDERSLFQTAVDRLDGIFPLDRIYVVTVDDQAEEIRKQFPGIPAENLLIEPMPKGTACVVGFAAAALHKRDPQAVMAVLTADHYIGNEPRFRDILASAHEVAQDGYLVTLGIEPTYAATGFGYIHIGERVGKFKDLWAYHGLQFKEKPDKSQARAMIAAGDHVWNSGMFVWRVEDILREFETQMPELALGLKEIESAWDSSEKDEIVQRVWHELQSKTIDYGIMEGAQHVAVIPASFLEWNDVGSWDALFDVLDKDQNGNILGDGETVTVDTYRSLLYSENGKRLIVAIGVQDLVLVDTGNVVMVCHKDYTQKVRQVVEKLKQDGKDNLFT
ncbi:MAG: sugar phosphate nucleotidyltransferase [Anaerolineales bacterium]